MLVRVLNASLKVIMLELSQLTFTCTNSTIKTLEKGVEYVQS